MHGNYQHHIQDKGMVGVFNDVDNISFIHFKCGYLYYSLYFLYWGVPRRPPSEEPWRMGSFLCTQVWGKLSGTLFLQQMLDRQPARSGLCCSPV